MATAHTHTHIARIRKPKRNNFIVMFLVLTITPFLFLSLSLSPSKEFFLLFILLPELISSNTTWLTDWLTILYGNDDDDDDRFQQQPILLGPKKKKWIQNKKWKPNNFNYNKNIVFFVCFENKVFYIFESYHFPLRPIYMMMILVAVMWCIWDFLLFSSKKKRKSFINCIRNKYTQNKTLFHV